MRCAYPCFILLSSWFAVACTPSPQQTAVEDRLRDQIYFTKEDPGRWKDFAKDHAPQIKKISPGQIEIDLPMTAESGHYIEAIIVVDTGNRELAAKSFKRAEKPHAQLSLSADKMNGATVIAKCNLHGMWRAEIK